MAGHGSQNQDPQRRGSPAPDAREPVRPDPSGTRGPLDHARALFRSFDRAFSRTFTAMAMAEDGTRRLALEQLGGDDGSDLRRVDDLRHHPTPESRGDAPHD